MLSALSGRADGDAVRAGVSCAEESEDHQPVAGEALYLSFYRAGDRMGRRLVSGGFPPGMDAPCHGRYAGCLAGRGAGGIFPQQCGEEYYHTGISRHGGRPGHRPVHGLSRLVGSVADSLLLSGAGDGDHSHRPRPAAAAGGIYPVSGGGYGARPAEHAI